MCARILLPGLLFLLSSCAAPLITSDHIMFPVDPKKETKKSGKTRFYQSNMMTAELPNYKEDLIKQFVDGLPDENKTDYDGDNFRSTAPYGLTFLKLNFASQSYRWGLSIQPPILSGVSLDGTLKLNDFYYVSGGAFMGGFLGLVQRRIHWNGKTGSSVGLYGHIRSHSFRFVSSGIFSSGLSGNQSTPPNGESVFIGTRLKYIVSLDQTRWAKEDVFFMLTPGFNLTFQQPAIRMGIGMTF